MEENVSGCFFSEHSVVIAEIDGTRWLFCGLDVCMRGTHHSSILWHVVQVLRWMIVHENDYMESRCSASVCCLSVVYINVCCLFHLWMTALESTTCTMACS